MSMRIYPLDDTDGVSRNGLTVVRSPADDSSHDQQDKVTSAVAQIIARRAVIDQAKGMLMCVYGIDADAAFQLLRWQSQHHNVKLRSMAEQITRDFRNASERQTPTRRTYDELLVTAYTRIEGTPAAGVVENMAQLMTISDSAGG